VRDKRFIETLDFPVEEVSEHLAKEKTNWRQTSSLGNILVDDSHLD